MSSAHVSVSNVIRAALGIKEDVLSLPFPVDARRSFWKR